MTGTVAMSIPKPLVKVGVGCLVVMVTCIGGLGIWMWHVLGGKINPATDYAAEINTLVASYQKDAQGEPDAWQDLMVVVDRSKQIHEAARAAQTGELANILPDPSLLRSLRGVGDGSPEATPANLDAARKLLDDLAAQKVFSDMDALAPRKRAVRKLAANGGMLIEVLLPDLGSLRQFARANAARYHLAVMRGDMTEAVQAFETGLAMGRFLTQQGILIDRLVGTAITTLHTSAMMETIDKIPDDGTLAKLMAAIDRQCVVPPITLSIETERRSVLDTIQWTFTDTGNGNGYLSMQRLAMVQSLAGNRMPQGQVFLSLVTANRKDTTEATNRYFDEMVKYAELPRPARLKSAFQPDNEVQTLSQRYLMLKILLPALGTAVNTNDRLTMDIQGTRLMLAIERWRRGHGGEPPAKLDDLVPSMLHQLPVDPITGQNFGYKVLPAGSDYAGRRYLVYTFGNDGVDDGGVQEPDSPAVPGARFSTINRTGGRGGYDFVLNHVEPTTSPKSGPSGN